MPEFWYIWHIVIWDACVAQNFPGENYSGYLKNIFLLLRILFKKEFCSGDQSSFSGFEYIFKGMKILLVRKKEKEKPGTYGVWKSQ